MHIFKSHLPFSIKKILKKMCQFGVPVRNNLKTKKTIKLWNVLLLFERKIIGPSYSIISSCHHVKAIRLYIQTFGEIPFCTFPWFSLRTSIHVLNVIKLALILPMKEWETQVKKMWRHLLKVIWCDLTCCKVKYLLLWVCLHQLLFCWFFLTLPDHIMTEY